MPFEIGKSGGPPWVDDVRERLEFSLTSQTTIESEAHYLVEHTICFLWTLEGFKSVRSQRQMWIRHFKWETVAVFNTGFVYIFVKH